MSAGIRTGPTVSVLAYAGMSAFEIGIVTEVFGLPRPEFDVPWYDLARRGLGRLDPGEHAGVDPAWIHTVHGDALSGQGGPDRLGQAVRGGLAGGVTGHQRHAGEREQGQHVDHRSPAGRGHARGERPDDVEGAQVVGVHLAGDRGPVGAERVGEGGRSRVVDQQPDAGGGPGRRGDLARVGQVEADRYDPVAGAGQGGERGQVAGGRVDAGGAPVEQGFDQRVAEPAVAAGDEGGGSGDFHASSLRLIEATLNARKYRSLA